MNLPEKKIAAWTPPRIDENARRELVRVMEAAAKKAGMDRLPERE